MQINEQQKCASSNYLVEGSSLKSFYANAFCAMGVPEAHAWSAAEGIFYADLHGFDTHGAVNFDRIYLRMLREGSIDPVATPIIIGERMAVALVDGRNALGFVTGSFAMNEAIYRARAFGIGAVAVKNSSHCGSMGFYAKQAIDAGLIGLAFSNLGTQGILRPPYGARALLGTNVLAAGAPANRNAAYNLDMSTAVTSAGRIRLAQKQGESIPPGWLLDDMGKAVTDPSAFECGTAHLQFAGEHKGYGLAILVDILCGLLTGASVGPNLTNLQGDGSKGRSDKNIGHFFLALNIADFRSVDLFTAEMDEMLSVLQACPTTQANKQVMYPGLPEAEEAMRRKKSGIPLTQSLMAVLEQVARQLDIEPPKQVSSPNSEGATISRDSSEFDTSS
ncbi:Ldh family oxidoreductase [Nostoc sp. CHAB 5715]|uniref:Ldh family oxidoreductase n=1 Tax=Nostoc sp. CHAB 5715 TaxID=2780400 RepID=UPI001E5C6D40|nr:Ldh family oxidoreductase [Nostoc sp. CHAB 5715]MCC5625836.1 Ldh family oxidoreductase [Nostoc sp. CHAB 5715]